MNLKQLRQQAVDLRREMAAKTKERADIGNAAVAGKRAMTDAERAKFAELGTQIDALRVQQEDTTTLLAAAEEANAAEKDPNARVVTDPDAEAAQRSMQRAGLRSPAATSEQLTAPRGRRFEQLFPAQAGAMEGWTSAGEYLGVIAHRLSDGRLRAASMTEGVPSDGGFAVPPQVFGSWLNQSLEDEIVRPRATTWPMTSNELRVPALDDLNRSTGTIGNLALHFEGELQVADLQAAKLRMVVLHPHRGAIYVEISNEALADAPTLEAQLSAALVRVLGFGLDTRFLFGDGVTGPLGALVSPATIVVTRTGSNQIVYEDVLAMFARLTPGSVSRAVWVAHPSTIPMLATMSVAVGTGGAPIPVMTSSDGSFTVLTRPVIFSEKMKPLGTQGDLALCDFASYAIGLRSGATLDRSQHVGFMQNSDTWRLQIRVDGQPTIQSPITPLNGSTLSPFVVLG
jgi:HK97 family phage major capsid protein